MRRLSREEIKDACTSANWQLACVMAQHRHRRQVRRQQMMMAQQITKTREQVLKQRLTERMADELSWWDLIKVAFWRVMR